MKRIIVDCPYFNNNNNNNTNKNNSNNNNDKRDMTTCVMLIKSELVMWIRGWKFCLHPWCNNDNKTI